MNFLRQLLDMLLAPIRAILSSPMSLLSAPQRMMRMSLPTRIAVFVEIFLLICTIGAYAVFVLEKKSADSNVWLEWDRIAAIVFLLIVIPFVVHRAVTLWLEGEVSQYPDIDRAWKAGIAALAAEDIDLSSAPMFLVTGVRDEKQAASMFGASRLNLPVHDVPEGAAALNWYANADGIFLVCTQVGRLSKLAELAAKGVRNYEAPRPAAKRDSPKQGNPTLAGTMVIGGRSSQDEPAAPEPAAEPAAPSPSIFGTMVAVAKSMVVPVAKLGQGGVAGALRLTIAQANEQKARLEYLCQLVRRGRQPYCPINGILTVFPFSLVQRVDTDVTSCSREDLRTIRSQFKLRCPAVALVAGMEAEPGFQELVQRVGEQYRDSKFGKGFNMWNEPTSEQIEAVSKHACGKFEDFTYMLFREAGGLRHPGNSKLFSLLCRIRSHVCDRLERVLVDAYSTEPGNSDDDPAPLLFSGCYFAATGADRSQQAFVAGVIDKLLTEEGELDWADEAREEDDWYLRLAGAALVVTGLLFLSFVGMLVYHKFGT